MIILGKVNYETLTMTLAYWSIFMMFLIILCLRLIFRLYQESTQLYVKIELLRRNHPDHTQDDIDKFIKEKRAELHEKKIKKMGS